MRNYKLIMLLPAGRRELCETISHFRRIRTNYFAVSHRVIHYILFLNSSATLFIGTVS
ncbi:MAG: hypothetical protein UW08_C0012G0012 [Parcubacteria group bacterium GW2011_GWB1_43_8b]|nr:MAG: hypothetical protein UW08_C0012G0012 [Parcubacteria group bacterium GW2011_GWB1_43_8b]